MPPHDPVIVSCAEIDDWASFHRVFTERLGFPDFYGKNMDAWIDCMTSLDEPSDGMTTVHAPPDSPLHLVLTETKRFRERCPEIWLALLECAAFVNWRRIDVGERPVLLLSAE